MKVFFWGSLVHGRSRSMSDAPPATQPTIEHTPTQDPGKYLYDVVDFPVWAVTGVPCSFKLIAKDDQGNLIPTIFPY